MSRCRIRHHYLAAFTLGAVFALTASLAAARDDVRTEVSAGTPGQHLPVFSVHDTDQDGYLSPEEFRAFRERRRIHHAARARPSQAVGEALSFEHIDADRDGRISQAEMVSALQHRPRGSPGAGGHGGPAGPGPRHWGGDRGAPDGR